MQQYILPILQWGCFFLLICRYSFVLNVICVGYKYFSHNISHCFPINMENKCTNSKAATPTNFYILKKKVKIHITQSIMSNFLIFHCVCVCIYLQTIHKYDNQWTDMVCHWICCESFYFYIIFLQFFSKINILITILSTTNKYGCLWITLALMLKISFL